MTHPIYAISQVDTHKWTSRQRRSEILGFFGNIFTPNQVLVQATVIHLDWETGWCSSEGQHWKINTKVILDLQTVFKNGFLSGTEHFIIKIMFPLNTLIFKINKRGWGAAGRLAGRQVPPVPPWK